MRAKRTSNLFKPKTAQEIGEGLDMVKSIDDLYIGHEYLVLDLGTNKWVYALEYDGFDGDYYVFSSTFADDDYKITYTPKEIGESIANREIAFDPRGMPY